MKKFLVGIVVVIAGLIVYANFQESGQSAGKNPSSPATTPVAAGTASSSPVTASTNQPSGEKNYILDQIKLTAADGVMVSSEKEYLNSMLKTDRDRDQLMKVYGRTLPSSFYAQTMSVNGVNCSIIYIAFSSSAEAVAAYQHHLQYRNSLPKKLQDMSVEKGAVCGNYVLEAKGTPKEFSSLLINKVLQKAR